MKTEKTLLKKGTYSIAETLKDFKLNFGDTSKEVLNIMD